MLDPLLFLSARRQLCYLFCQIVFDLPYQADIKCASGALRQSHIGEAETLEIYDLLLEWWSRLQRNGDKAILTDWRMISGLTEWCFPQRIIFCVAKMKIRHFLFQNFELPVQRQNFKKSRSEAAKKYMSVCGI